MKKILMLVIAAAFACLLSCGKGTTPEPQPEPEPEPVADSFAKGGDISWITEMESKGYKFYNASGKEMECTALLQSIGFNAVRYRVWVNPSGNYNTKEDVLAKAKRARALGMKIMIDFHYSDTWADPGKQTKPAAWKNYNTEKLASAVASHTEEVLKYLKNNGIDVEWVQVGNEVTNGMLWEDCRVSGNDATAFVKCFNAGAAAVRGVYPDASVILHIDNAWNYETLAWFYKLVDSAGADYDMVGLSLYPSYWDSTTKTFPDWTTKTYKAVNNFKTIHNLTGKPVMLAELGMPVSEPQKARQCLQYILDNTEDWDWFKGVFLWEPESEKSRNGYEYGAFADGVPTQALDPFKE